MMGLEEIREANENPREWRKKVREDEYHDTFEDDVHEELFKQ